MSEAVELARKRNWLIYRSRGALANLVELKSQLGQESRITKETYNRFHKAIAELDNATQDIIKELSNGS